MNGLRSVSKASETEESQHSVGFPDLLSKSLSKVPPVEKSDADHSEVVSDCMSLYLYSQYLVSILVNYHSAITELHMKYHIHK